MLDVDAMPPGQYAVLVALVVFLSTTVGGLVAGDVLEWTISRAGAIAIGAGVMVFGLRRADPG